MEKEKVSAYRRGIGLRIQGLMGKADLTTEGFAALLNILPSELTSIIEGVVVMPNALLKKVANAFSVRMILFLNLDEPLPKRFTKSKSVKLFQKAFKTRTEYFLSKTGNSDINRFMYSDLVNSRLLSTPAYLSEIKDYMKSQNVEDIPVHMLIRYLDKLVRDGFLVKNMALIQLKDGSYGTREVAVYSKNRKKRNSQGMSR